MYYLNINLRISDGRTEANLNDLGLAFEQLGISISELEDYVHHVEPVPFAHEVVAFPAPKSSNLGFPNPRSREILQHREEHIPDHLPYMFPNLKGEFFSVLYVFSLFQDLCFRFITSVIVVLKNVDFFVM